jgi:flagellar biogenesis protein FliO
MERSERTQLFKGSNDSNEERSIVFADVQGLEGWVLGLFRVWRSKRETSRKQLRVVEMLPLGGKRQLMLIACAGENFLVGVGVDSVGAIVHLNAEKPLSVLASSSDEPCR